MHRGRASILMLLGLALLIAPAALSEPPVDTPTETLPVADLEASDAACAPISVKIDQSPLLPLEPALMSTRGADEQNLVVPTRERGPECDWYFLICWDGSVQLCCGTYETCTDDCELFCGGPCY